MVEVNQESEQWFSRKVNKQARVRMFCFHFAGGGASSFRSWQNKVPDWVEMVCVQLPGREGRAKEPLVSDLDSVLESLQEAIEPYLDLPYVFFGHSMGAFLCHELTKAMEKTGEQRLPAYVVVSGKSAPSDQSVFHQGITHLSDTQFLEEVYALGGIPQAAYENKALMKFYGPILKSDFMLAECPSTEPMQISSPLIVFGGESDYVPRHALQLWAKETTSSCDIQIFPGEHFFIKSAEGAVLEKLWEVLYSTDQFQTILPYLAQGEFTLAPACKSR